MIDFQKIEAVILAGGKSSRMGEDKGLIQINGRPMISYSVNMLRSLNIPFRIVSHIDAYKQFNCEVIRDIIPERGPMGGLYTSLLSCTASRLLLLSCDTPFISKELIIHLVNKSVKEKIYVPSFRNKIYPLCSIYPKNILPRVKHFIDYNHLKMKTLIACLPHEFVNVDELLSEEQYILSNFNTRSDIEDFIKTGCHGN